MAGEQPDMAERTEPATPKRREDTRRQGQVAQSREIQTVAILWAVFLASSSFVGLGLVLQIATFADVTWASAGGGLEGLADHHAALLHAMSRAGRALLPMLLLLAAAGTVAAVAQIGPMFSAEVLKPKASRLSLVSGLRRMAEPDRFFDLAKALFKLGVVGTITYTVISSSFHLVPATLQASLAEALRVAGRLGLRVALSSLAFLSAMAVVDLVYVRLRHEKRIRMSRKEVRDEVKDREGSPHVRSRARAMQQEISRSRMIEAVSDASVVVTNPTHYAVALRYSREEGTPRVLAKGRNHVARRIREEARRHDVPIVENPPLARVLHKTTRVGQEVPESLFQAVAEVLAYVYRVDARRAREWGAAG